MNRFLAWFGDFHYASYILGMAIGVVIGLVVSSLF